jgi:hypothetical protein
MSTATATAASATAATTRRYAPPAPAPLPDDYEAFYASLTDAERELDALARQMLGSSYIIQWTNMYIKWKKSKTT